MHELIRIGDRIVDNRRTWQHMLESGATDQATKFGAMLGPLVTQFHDEAKREAEMLRGSDQDLARLFRRVGPSSMDEFIEMWPDWRAELYAIHFKHTPPDLIAIARKQSERMSWDQVAVEMHRTYGQPKLTGDAWRKRCNRADKSGR